MPIDANKTNLTTSRDDHPNHHNALAEEANALRADFDAFVAVAGDTNVIADATITVASSAGATTLTCSAVETHGFIAVEPFSVNCEVRHISSVSGSVVTLSSALALAHADDSRVIFFHGQSLPVTLFGIKGDGTDEEAKLQQACNQGGPLSLTVDLCQRTITVDKPILWNPNQRIAHGTIKAKSTFTPAETNNALVMSMQGSIRTFTADAGTNTITTSSAHGLPGDGTHVVFKGASLPGGLTAGKMYYAYNRTANTYTVSETIGGGTVDITSAGSGGTAYHEVISLEKVYVDDVMIYGNAVAGINGFMGALQQQAEFYKFRIDQCPGTALHITGQQAVFVNFEAITNGKAIVLDNASFMYFYGTNFEQFEKGLHVITSANSPNQMGGGAADCGFWGLHVEPGSSATTVVYDLEGQSTHMTFDNVYSASGVVGAKHWYVHTGSPSSSSYSITHVRFAGIGATTGIAAIDDDDRAISFDQWDDFRGHITEFHAPLKPTADGYTDPQQFMVAGPDGRYIKYGGANYAIPSMQFRPSTVQATGWEGASDENALTVWRDSAGNAVTWVDARGVLVTQQNSQPDTYYLSAGQVYWWFDDTAGAAKVKFRGKNASGTVVAGEIALS